MKRPESLLTLALQVLGLLDFLIEDSFFFFHAFNDLGGLFVGPEHFVLVASVQMKVRLDIQNHFGLMLGREYLMTPRAGGFAFVLISLEFLAPVGLPQLVEQILNVVRMILDLLLFFLGYLNRFLAISL